MGGGDGKLKRQASQMQLTDIPQVVKDLKAAQDSATKEKLVHLIDCLSVQADKNPSTLVAAGVIKPLVDLLDNGNDGCQVHASSTLATIAASNSDFQMKIVDAGAIPPLVQILKSGSNKAQVFAAYAIAELSEQRSQQDPIVRAGAVVPLVRLLRSDVTEDAHLHAADAVANLSVGNTKSQKAFFEAGAVPLLLDQLYSGKSQMSVANAIAKLLSPGAEPGAKANTAVQSEIMEKGGIAPLLALLNAMSVEAQVNAAEALSNLARDNPETQMAIAKAGGIAPLLAMLPCKSQEAQAQGASALAQLTRYNRENQSSFSKQGGIQQLVPLLTNKNLTVQAMAALCLTEVVKDNRENQTLASETGCIANLVDQLKNNDRAPGVEEVKAEAAGAIWVLSDHHDKNKQAVADAGGIQPTVMILAGGTARAQEHSAYALASLGAGNVTNQRQITTLLVGCLSSGSAMAKANATALLEKLVQENPTSQQEIAMAGPLLDLIGLLKDGSDGAKRFALWSLSLSISPDNQKTLLEEGVIDPIVAALTSDESSARQQAAAAISRLALKNPKTQLALGEKGAITPLIDIVKGGLETMATDEDEDEGTAKVNKIDVAARQFAAAALASLASLKKNGDKMVELGVLEPLVTLLNKGDNLGKQHASAALARLATGSKKTPAALDPSRAIAAIKPLVTLLDGTCGDGAQEEAAGALFALADELGNRVAIANAGGIQPIVTLLGSSNPMSQNYAKEVLVRLSIESANRALIIKQLVDMLAENGSSAQESACAALANLASDSAENRGSIVEAGGIAPLLSIIEQNTKAKEASLKAISKLAYKSESIQSAITAAGGIPLLVNSLASSSNAKEMMAQAGLYSLAANALSQLAKGSRENQSKISEAGAIPSLVSILGTPVPDLQANAAECLGNLAGNNPDIQAAIARTGAIAPLCTLLRDGQSDEVKEQAAAALWSLSLDNKPNKDTVAKLGGVEPLVNLLVMGTSESSLDQATGALSSMSSKHTENRETICKLIVARLGSKAQMLQTPTGAVRLLKAVARMCHGSNSNQAAIAKAGGVPTLIMWLSGGFSDGKTGGNLEAQAAAADALLSMVSNNDPLQALIARSNGIQPLIELLTSGTAVTQVGVSRLLWHLSGNLESATAVVACGGVQPLCAMLGSGEPRAQELAATVILRLLKAPDRAVCTQVSTMVTEQGGVLALVKLLCNGSPAGQQQATCVIAEIAQSPGSRAAIATAGGIEALVGLLTSNVEGGESVAPVGAEGAEPPRRRRSVSTELRIMAAEGAARREQIAASGGIKQLIVMLSAVSLSSSIIGRKMWELVSKVIGATPAPESGEAKGGGAKKAGGVDDEVMGVQEQAAGALGDVACGDSAMQRLIVEGGGVPPLLALLRSSSTVSQANAARAIWHLCSSVEHQARIVDSNAIPELVQLSRTGSAAAQGFAAAVISELAKGAIIEREKQQLLPDDEKPTDRLSVIAQAGGITPLVGLLSTGDAAGKEMAASALLHLCVDAANRDAVARAGGIPPLVQLLDDSAPQAHGPSMAALARLGHGNADHQTQIAKKLVGLLSPSQSSGAQRRASHALWELAKNNEGAPGRIVNAGGISPLVALMGRAPEDVYEEAVGALSCLAHNDPSNQLAIATGLVALLCSAPDAPDSAEKLPAMVAQFAAATDMRAVILEAGDAVRAVCLALGEGEGDAAEASTAHKKLKKMKSKRSQRTLSIEIEEVPSSPEPPLMNEEAPDEGAGAPKEDGTAAPLSPPSQPPPQPPAQPPAPPPAQPTGSSGATTAKGSKKAAASPGKLKKLDTQKASGSESRTSARKGQKSDRPASGRSPGSKRTSKSAPPVSKSLSGAALANIAE
ncbi:beta-glucan synthesis-associated [Chrysochromulina tobinii]|uniref:Beta-glucan synthesis-associated n=1 Tax=Chrysochromulina tobinii TaxID=1460289 RepID=A0A0M0K189_9EUKA|nr:beta-glucan synthesis-associated [Chrysochromulina tobinii]|eukprot:KOO32569.1 beta-glucan synthesis-associated [Chrysochromulina sp. CCMP291]